MRRFVGTVVLLTVLTGLAACGSAQDDRAQPGAPSAPSSAQAPSTEGPSVPTSPDRSGKSGKKGTVELRGTVEAGVEAGCLMLQSGGRTYSLIGGDRDVVKPGAKVVVRGTEEPDLL